MIVYSLDAEATARRAAFPGDRIVQKTTSGRNRVRAAAGRPVRRRVRGGQIATDRTGVGSWASRAKPMGRNRVRLQRTAVCIAEIVAVPPVGTLRVRCHGCLNQGERNRAIGAHFPKVADIAAAAGLAARFAVRFKP